MKKGVLYAVLGGIAGLAAGVVLPFVLMPHANQGPFWVFVTAPLGVLFGMVGGAKLARKKPS